MMGNMAGLLLNTDGENFVQGLLDVIGLIGVAIGVLLTFYAVFLMYLFATASDENKRRTAKKRIFTIASSLFIVVALVFSLSGIKKTIDIYRVSGGNGNNDSYTGSSALVNATTPFTATALALEGIHSAPPSRMKVYGSLVNNQVDTKITATASFEPAGHFSVSGGTVTAITNVEFVAASGILSGSFWEKSPASTANEFILKYEVYTNAERDIVGEGANAAGRRYITFQGDDMDKNDVRLAIRVTCTCRMGNAETGTEVTGITVNTWLIIPNPSLISKINYLTIEYQNASGKPIRTL